MLPLHINGEPVDLPGDFSVTLNLKNPMFSEVGSYSYPFKFLNTPRNARITGFLHRPESTGDPFKTAPCSLLWRGNALDDLFIKYSLLDKSRIEGSLLQGEGSFYNAIKEKKFRQINFGEQVFPNEETAISFVNWCNGKFYPQAHMAFPQIYNPLYFDPVTEDPQQEYFNFYRSSDNLIHVFTENENRTVIIPFLYLRYVLSSIFTGLGYSFSDLMFSKHMDYNKLVVYNSLSFNSLCPDFTYPLTDIFLNMHLPDMKLGDFLTGVETHFNCRFFVDNLLRKVRLVSVDDIIKSTDYEEFGQRIESISTDTAEHKTGFHLAMSIDSDDETFNTASAVEDNLVSHVRPSVEKISDLPSFPFAEIGEIRFVESKDSYYFLSSQTKTWATDPITSQYLFSQFFFRDQSEKIDMKFSAVGDPLYPDLSIFCNNKMADWNKISPRIFFAAYNQGGIPIMTGKNNTGNFGLFFNQSNNLYDLHYKAFFSWYIKTKSVKVVKQLSFEEIHRLDFTRKYCINGINYLIKNIRVTLNLDRIKPATVELCQV